MLHPQREDWALEERRRKQLEVQEARINHRRGRDEEPVAVACGETADGAGAVDGGIHYSMVT